MSIVYRVESFAVVRDEGMALLDAHWQEVAQFKTVQKLDPDWDQYALLEEKGRYWLLAMRDNGILVGYIGMILGYHLHYRTLKTAIDDVHFLHPAYREGLAGYKLLKFTVRAMREKGIQMCCFRTKAFKNHGKLFERLGFVQHDVVYAGLLQE